MYNTNNEIRFTYCYYFFSPMSQDALKIKKDQTDLTSREKGFILF